MVERIGKDKSPAPSGIRTHDPLITRWVFYRCATTTAQVKTLDERMLTNVAFIALFIDKVAQLGLLHFNYYFYHTTFNSFWPRYSYQVVPPGFRVLVRPEQPLALVQQVQDLLGGQSHLLVTLLLPLRNICWEKRPGIFIFSELPAFHLPALQLHFRADRLPMIGARQP